MKIFGWEVRRRRDREYEKWKSMMVQTADETLAPEDVLRQRLLADAEWCRLVGLLNEQSERVPEQAVRENRQ